MKIYIFSLLFFVASMLSAQPTNNLVGYYTFDDCDATDSSGSSSGVVVGNPICVCGAEGDGALKLNGFEDNILLLNSINNNFDRDDFTVSFYIKPNPNVILRQEVLTKRENCSEESFFSIRYNAPASNFITVELNETVDKKVILIAPLDFGLCWQHITFVREGNKAKLYINGTLRKDGVADTRVNVSNPSVLTIGDDPCFGYSDQRFAGTIDELRVYSVALDKNEVTSLYASPDKITSPDTTIFLGGSAPVQLGSVCANSFLWSPVAGVDTIDKPNPILSPIVTTVYEVEMSDGECIATDSIVVTVIDPNNLPCDEVYLAKAFTPNGDGLNDEYGISNPYAIKDLISFEIYDRWGGRVYYTDDPMGKWDGSLRGQELNSGVFLYRVRFLCNGIEEITVGSLSIVR